MIGRTIGFPTANLHIAEEYKLFPCDGVYLVKSILDNSEIFGMMNIGFRPTLKGKKRSFEIHYFDFNADLYHQSITVDVLQLIRKETKFDSLEALKEQLQKDRAICKKLIPSN